VPTSTWGFYVLGDRVCDFLIL